MALLDSLGRMLAFAIGTEIIFQLLQFFKSIRKRQISNETEICDVAFFPDAEIACKDYFGDPLGCVNPDCKYTHIENSLAKLIKNLCNAKISIDICIYTITCLPLVDILISKSDAGVTVRVITDVDQAEATGSQLWKLRSKGICVRTNQSKFYMHHKFAIVDNHVLLNGSFNWTRNAISGNQENLIITNHTGLVKRYVEEYRKLWLAYDPNAKSEIAAQ